VELKADKAHRVVVGMGSPHGDDRLGWMVLEYAQRLFTESSQQQLHPQPQASVQFIYSDRSVFDWIAQIRSNTVACFFVDAVLSGAAVGTLHCLDLQRELPGLGLGLTGPAFTGFSSHGFSLFDAVTMARALGRLPPKNKVLGIELGQWQAGQSPGPTVLRSIPSCAALLCRELQACENNNAITN